MDALDRITALQNGAPSILSESNSNICLPISPLKLDFDDSMIKESDNKENEENKENIENNLSIAAPEGNESIQDEITKNDNEEITVETCNNATQNTILADDLDKLFGIPSINLNFKDSWPGLISDESMNDVEDDEDSKIENKKNQPKMKFKPNLRSADLIQFLSPNIQKQLGKKATPKSRFQPKRKSSSRKIDYSDVKRTPKATGGIRGRLMNKLNKKKDEHGIRKNDKTLRVSRKSVAEISKMKKLRKQTHSNRLRNEKNMKLALESGGYLPVRSMNITKPKEFNLTVAGRPKTHNMSTRSTADKPFETKLRKQSDPHDFKNENTVPVPFKFTLSQKNNIQVEKWKSMAQAASDFQTKTPTRFRLKPSQEDKSMLEKKSATKKSVTMPVTPKLLTRGRSRRYKIESALEIEEKQLEEMKNFRFKANEINPKIMEKGGMYGVKNVPVASTTEAKPFRFEIEERICNRTSKDMTLAEESSILDKTKSTTTTAGGKLKPTKIKPFSFEVKDKERYAKKDEKIKETILQEKKLAEFQASLLPSFSPDSLPEVKAKKATKLKPFKISQGSLSYQTKFDMTLKQEEEEEKSRREFKAQSADVIKKQPFQPTTGLIPSTQFAKVKLNTDARAEERETQQYWKQLKEKEAEEERIEAERKKKVLEKREVRELRKQIVHKAQPVPNYKPMEIKKSNLPLTEPQTPNLQVKQRAQLRTNKTRLDEET